jgi:hypothetical protein
VTIHADKTDKPKKTVTVYINSRAFELEKEFATFEELLEITFPGEITPESVGTITYTRERGQKTEELHPGERVKLQEGMRFDVDATNRS